VHRRGRRLAAAQSSWWKPRSWTSPPASPRDLLKQPRFGFGALCIFLYVGAEVAIGSLIVNYLMQSSVLGLGQEDAGKHVPFYWGGAMVGRFIGAYLLRVFSPGKVLACVAGGVIALLCISANTSGRCPAGRCWPSDCSIPSCSPRSSRWPARAWVREPRRLGNHLCGDRRRRRRAVDHRPCRRLGGSLKMALIVPAVCYAGILGSGFMRAPRRDRSNA
jgi:hypothetical protein